MRACTSLAGHILGSHPQINGYYEMHVSYDSEAALARQLSAYQQDEVLKANGRYLFDKLLHNDYTLDLSLPGLSDCRLLVSLMAPERTIRSIVHLFGNKSSDELYASPAEAAEYYIARLQWLKDFCSAAGHAYYYYDAELFQAAPERLLKAMTGWLALDSPLREEYQVFSQTGQARKGDSSALIHSGRIGKDRTDYSHIEIPADVLAQAQSVYEACRAEMVKGAASSVAMHEREL